MSVILGIDPTSASTSRQVAINRGVGTWRALQGQGGQRAQRVILSVPSHMLTFRNLTVPFTDRKRANDVVRQELANTLPMPMEDVVWSVCALGKHEYLAVVTPRKRLETLKASLGAVPDVIDAQPFSYSRVLAASGIKDAMVVDCSATRTTFCRVQNGRPHWVRVLLRGADAATGLTGPALTSFVERMVTDAVLSDQLAAGSMVYVTGDGAALPGLSQALSDALQRSVTPFPVPEGLSSERDVSALGAALRSVYPDDGVDLLHQAGSDAPSWIPGAIWAAVLLLLLTVDLGLRWRAAVLHQMAAASSITTDIKQVAPDLKDPTLAAFQARVEELRKQQQPPSGPSILEIMKDVAQQGVGHNVKLRHLTMAEGKVRVKGEALNTQEEVKFQESLKEKFEVTVLTVNHVIDSVGFEYQLGVKK